MEDVLHCPHHCAALLVPHRPGVGKFGEEVDCGENPLIAVIRLGAHVDQVRLPHLVGFFDVPDGRDSLRSKLAAVYLIDILLLEPVVDSFLG